uniref:Palmitoyltransferase n=1 Tax=Latimeria chalumnae TaxID=7897 RepID=H3A1V2_LATCH
LGAEAMERAALPPPSGSNPRQALWEAAQSGDLERVQSLLRGDPSRLQQTGWSGFTLLHVAAFHGNKELTLLLLRYGADPNAPNDAGETPFHFACRRGDTYLVHQIWKHGADVTRLDSQGKSALQHAVAGGSVLAICYLEEMGRLSFQDTDRFLVTPLHLAASMGNVDVVKYLLKNDRCRPDASDCWGMTPMHVAADRGATDVSWLLLQSSGFRLLHLQNEAGLTPLDLAEKGTTYRHQQIVKMLSKYIKEPLDKKPKEPLGTYYWSLLSPGISSSAILALAGYLGEKSGYIVVVLFAALAKIVFSQNHRLSNLHRSVSASANHCEIENNVFLFSIWPARTLLLVVSAWAVLLLGTFRVVLTKDPGRLQGADRGRGQMRIAELVEEELGVSRFCIECEVIQPPRTKHCKLCNVCMIEYDHHCLFLMNCVARNNHRIFLLFLMEVIVAQLLFLLSAVSYMLAKYDPNLWAKRSSIMESESWVLVLALMNLASFVGECWLLREQFAVVSMGSIFTFQDPADDKMYTWKQRWRTLLTFLFTGRRSRRLQDNLPNVL